MCEKIRIREMKISDYTQVMGLWSESEGVGLSEADSLENIALFLKRNNGLSFVAEQAGKIVGAILCGQDGRRGYLYHLSVNKEYRRQKIASKLVGFCLAKLEEHGIQKCHIFVFPDNQEGISFWDNYGFKRREDLFIFSTTI
ncbi:MAG: GCN5-related N-acetyltransferase [Firmicutes bacterium]|nr:GCN5-related N-acetyltransferase [Bacillota bacterium]